MMQSKERKKGNHYIDIMFGTRAEPHVKSLN